MRRFITILILLMSNLCFGIGEQILDAGNPYTISTTYDGNDLFDVQFVQSADTMYLAHSNYVPQLLTRTSDTSWTIVDLDFQRGPFLDENTSATTITPSGTTGSITLTASSSTFSADHVGALWKVTHRVGSTDVSGDFTATGNSSTVTLQLNREFDFTTHGTWDGTVLLQRSYDAGSTYSDIVTFTSDSDGNISFADSEIVDDATYRVRMDQYTSGTCSYVLAARSFDVDGVVDITAYTSGTVVTGTVEYTLGGTGAVTTWAEGAWSPDEGYPSCVAFYEERLVFASTTNSPQTMWFSQTDDWNNFLAGTLDTAAMAITFASDQVNVIRWMSPQAKLVVGTSGAEWTLGGTDPDEALTPSNISAKRHSSNGSKLLQSITVDNQVFYVQRQGMKVRQIKYSFEEDTWKSPDMTLFSEHITDSGIKDWAYQQNPYPILWCVLVDGDVAALTFEDTQQVAGWHKHTHNGSFESVAVIPGTNEDRVWFVTSNTIDSNSVTYVEQMQEFDWGDDQEDIFFVDSGLSYDGGAAVTVTGVTKADPAVVSATAHGFSDGDQVRFASVVGMTELNNNVYSVGTLPNADSFQIRDSTDITDINSVDFTAYTSGGTAIQVENAFSDANHLEGETIIVSADGGYHGTATVASDSFTLSDFYNTVHYGLAYTAKLQPMKLSSPSDTGALFGTNKRIHEITLRLYETLACDAGTSWTTYDSMIFRDADDPLEAAPPLYSDDKTMEFEGDYETSGDIFIQSRLPLPLTVLALKIDFENYP